MESGFGLEYREKPLTYDSLKGEYVRVICNGSTFLGKLEQVNKESLVLRPSLVLVPLEIGPRSYIEESKPTFVSSENISIIPIPEGYLAELSNESKYLFGRNVRRTQSENMSLLDKIKYLYLRIFL